MPNIRPITDLRNHFSEISKQIHSSPEPIILTKNGYGDMVVMSLEAFDAMALQNRIDLALLKAEIKSRENDVYNDFDEVAEEKRSFRDFARIFVQIADAGQTSSKTSGKTCH